MNRKSKRRILRFLSHIPGVYALLAFAFARRVTVNGGSMTPTLAAGERLLIDRLAYVRDLPQRGDIVMATHPLKPELRMVKRLTGLPGDKVEERTLKRGEYWVLGDNAGASTDSRAFGPVRARHLLGRAWLVYWPTGRWRTL